MHDIHICMSCMYALTYIYNNVYTGKTGWANELSIHLPLWYIVGFEPTGSNSSRFKSVT